MPTRQEIDPVSPNNPVFIPRGGHVVTVNTKTLELAGITKDTPNPEGGVIVRDRVRRSHRHAAAERRQSRAQDRAAPDAADRAFQAHGADAMQDLNSFGIVGVVEPGVDERGIALYRRVHDAGEMTVRTDVLYRAMKQGRGRERHRARCARRRTATWLRFVGIKFPLDGGVEGGRMYLAVPHRAGRADQPRLSRRAAAAARAARTNMSKGSS